MTQPSRRPTLHSVPPPPPPAGSQRALVVDNQAETCDALVDQLQALGLQADAVPDAAAALARVAEADAAGRPYSLCLVDWQLPGEDGLALIQRLRALPLAHHPACWLTTARGAQLPAPMPAGLDTLRVLDKPIALQALQRTLADVLGLGAPPGLQVPQPLRWLPAGAGQPAPPTPPTPLEAPAPPAPAAAPWPQVPGLDASAGLRLVGGKPALYHRLLQRFVEHHGRDTATLRQAALQGDTDGIRRLCHVLKSVAGALGAQRLAECAAQVDASLAGRPATDMTTAPWDPGAVLALADQLETLLDALARALAEPLN